MRKLNFSRRAERFLTRAHPKRARQMAAKLLLLAEEPKPADCRPVSGTEYLRVTSGEYRIVYSYTASETRIIAIGKRNDDEIYRILKHLSGK